MSILITPDLHSSKQASLIAINRYIEELQTLQKKTESEFKHVEELYLIAFKRLADLNADLEKADSCLILLKKKHFETDLAYVSVDTLEKWDAELESIQELNAFQFQSLSLKKNSKKSLQLL